MTERLRKTTYKIEAPFSLKIAVLADFHDGDPWPILHILYEDPPDLIAIPGDLIRGHEPPPGDRLAAEDTTHVLPFLSCCAELAPTFISYGNHEVIFCEEDGKVFERTGAVVLDNSWTEVAINGQKVLIGGLPSGRACRYRKYKKRINEESDVPVRYPIDRKVVFAMEPTPETAWLEEFTKQPGYKVLLSHHPEYWMTPPPMLSGKKIDLVLSGHAHGGQICILGHGIISPDQGFFPKYTHGVHEGIHGKMIISRGLTNPMTALPRWGNPCEVVYAELSPAEQEEV